MTFAPVAARVPRYGRMVNDSRPQAVHELQRYDDGTLHRRARCGIVPTGEWERVDDDVTCERCLNARTR